MMSMDRAISRTGYEALNAALRWMAIAIGCTLLPVVAEAQYTGGIGRGTVQDACGRGDCTGTEGGSALPGATCDDGDICTVDDMYTADCECAGTFSDADDDDICDTEDACPQLFGEPGDSCNDGDTCTVDDGITDGCVCLGSFLDSDNDALCDALDNCPYLTGVIGGTCNDNTACTENDVVNENCVCTGTLATNVDATTVEGNWLVADGLVYAYTTPSVPGADYLWTITSDSAEWWTLVDAGATVYVTAPPLPELATLCVAVSDDTGCLQYGCTNLFVMDVGAEEITDTPADFSVVPNPSEGRFELVRHGAPVLAGFDVRDATGRTALLSGTIVSPRTHIDLEGASPGIYFLRVRHERGMEVLRLVVH